MKLNSLPKELMAEILDYLAEHEPMEALQEILDGEYTIQDAKAALRELSRNLRQQLADEKAAASAPDYRKNEQLSQRVKEVISALSPGHEKKLFARFGLLED